MTDPQTPATDIPLESCRSRGGANRIDYCVTHDAEWPVGHEFCDRVTFPDIAVAADPQTPATEAGRRYLEQDVGTLRDAILAIEAEARADAIDIFLRESVPHIVQDALGMGQRTAYDTGVTQGRADALREAAEAVRAVPFACPDCHAAVLAIVDPQP